MASTLRGQPSNHPTCHFFPSSMPQCCCWSSFYAMSTLFAKWCKKRWWPFGVTFPLSIHHNSQILQIESTNFLRKWSFYLLLLLQIQQHTVHSKHWQKPPRKLKKPTLKREKKIKWMKWMVGPIEVKIVYWNTLIFCSTKIWFSRCFVDVVTDHKRECELFSFYLILSSAHAVGWGEHEFICQYTSISMEISVQHCAMCANCAHSIQHSSWIYICTRHVYSSIANSYTRTKVDECFILFYAFFCCLFCCCWCCCTPTKKSTNVMNAFRNGCCSNLSLGETICFAYV